MKRFFEVICIFSLMFIPVQSRAQTSPQAPSAVFAENLAKSERGNLAAQLFIAHALAKGVGTDVDMNRAFGTYLTILLERRANESQRREIVEILRKDFSQNCDVDGICAPIIIDVDASLANTMISEGFTDFGRWGFSEREFQNLDLESLTRKSQIEYFYLDAIESAKNGDIIALLLLGQSFAISQKIANGASLRNEYFKQAADLGSSRAIAEYAHLVERNLVPGVEPATASASYQRAIDMGDASAMVRLANFYGPRNRRDEQFALLMRAANLGHIPAMSNLSAYHAFCENEPCDYDKAFDWAKKAFDLRVGPIYPDLFLMFTGLFDDEDTSPLAQWIRLKATSDPTLSEYREIWSKAIDGMTENQLAIARPKLLALSRKSGMGAVLAAETIAMWYELDCRPQAGGDYACPPRTGYYN
ncbi:MAG: hypothetical protein FD163_1662 [Hyphomonadaceae bacterium]|nr:MAG: hypothetical protein FD163_1662 [Hyphomonadaceae bacterium]